MFLLKSVFVFCLLVQLAAGKWKGGGVQIGGLAALVEVMCLGMDGQEMSG